MSGLASQYSGGCLCDALRYVVDGVPLYMGHCYCADCRKASGSGFIPFIGVASTAVHFTGATRIFTSRSASGTDAVRNFCAVCGSLVFGGVVGKDTSHTIYAGTLDDPALFQPSIAIFARDRPAWAIIPPGLTVYEAMPS
jgi:hypothetical protein